MQNARLILFFKDEYGKRRFECWSYKNLFEHLLMKGYLPMFDKGLNLSRDEDYKQVIFDYSTVDIIEIRKVFSWF